MEPLLSVSQLTKTFPTFKLDSIDLEIPRGCIVGLIGENGAGKSTTIRCLLDLLKPDSGQIAFWGLQMVDFPDQIKENIGVVYDELPFHDTFTPKQIEHICSKAYKQWNKQVYNRFLADFKLPEKQAIKHFSKGMRMKLSIAIALSHDPKLLILDEVTSGLDPIMRDDLLDVLLDFVQDENHSILISSHISSDLERIADYITFIHNGKLVFTKSKDVLRYEYGILRLNQSQFNALSSADILAYRYSGMQYDVLIADKQRIVQMHPDFIVDPCSIDEILLLYIKGESCDV